ncbi:hypothetical protein RCCS2_16391 [Roseobacter sp. CCS2]|nr:hypothetical protein RCCS2_16391 [Roseobacter sp. CCS2]
MDQLVSALLNYPLSGALKTIGLASNLRPAIERWRHNGNKVGRVWQHRDFFTIE